MQGPYTNQEQIFEESKYLYCSYPLENYKQFGLVDSLAAQMSSRFDSMPTKSAADNLGVKTLKNDPTFELADTDKQRGLLLAKLRGGSDFTSNKRKQALKGNKDFEEQTKTVTVNLMERMHEACLLDIEAIKTKRQALYRFKMIEEVTQLLRKKHIQDLFLEMQGCRFLEMWISQNPDGSYPPIQIVECVLGVLNNLPITQEHLESCQVARAVTQYVAGGEIQQSSEKLPSELVSNATKLL